MNAIVKNLSDIQESNHVIHLSISTTDLYTTILIAEKLHACDTQDKGVFECVVTVTDLQNELYSSIPIACHYRVGASGLSITIFWEDYGLNSSNECLRPKFTSEDDLFHFAGDDIIKVCDSTSSQVFEFKLKVGS